MNAINASKAVNASRNTYQIATNASKATNVKDLVALSAATKVLGCVGAGITVAECIYSWASENPVRTECQDAKTKLWESCVALTSAFNDFKLSIRNQNENLEQ